MAFLDDLSQRMIQHNQTSAQKAKAMSEISNLNSSISQEERMIADTYYQMGIQYFNKNKDNPNADFSNMISAIKAAEQRMEEYRQQIEKIKAIVKCKNCGAEIPTGFGLTYCNCCGTPIYKSEPVPSENYIRCFACGQTLSQDSRFCTGCGKPMSEIIQHYADASGAQAPSHPQETAEPPMDATSQTMVQSQPYAQAQEPAQNIKKTCPGCGSFISDEMIFCTGCGTKLK